MNNEGLKNKYEKIWGSNPQFFTPYFGETLGMINMYDWSGKEVLEIGCGEGGLSSMIASLGAKKVLATDYSSEAIKTCKKSYFLENLNFEAKSHKNLKGRFDVIVMEGVLEHIDKPFDDLNMLIKNHLRKNGVVIASCPSFLNLRGHIWMTLQLLFNVPMTLTDLHFFLPSDFENFCRKNKYQLEYKSVEQDWGSGGKLLLDYNKRLRNALKDKDMKGDVDRLLSWIKKIIKYQQCNNDTGAIIVYKIKKK
ncbi:MAG: class I SAM-dependent methyltransferase [Candidatus Staskawiczbacteria bacterium]|nr:class I SAM-dependent methyltransferase [Candidatus Staskawiczbacteria bacterium]